MTEDLLDQPTMLAAHLTSPLALAAKAGEAVLECVRDGRRYVVWCGHHENSTAHGAVRLLRKKLRDAQEEDEALFEAAPLSGQSLGHDQAAWASVTEGEDFGDGEIVLGGTRFGYQLVVYVGRSPVGYCTFVVRIDDAVLGREPVFELEILEIWVVPKHRGRGVGAALSQAVAQLAVAGLVDLESRLSADASPVSFHFRVCADIHSSSGARFLHLTTGYLREQIDELGVLFANGLQFVRFDDIELELR